MSENPKTNHWLLSHHTDAEIDRCICLPGTGAHYCVCARCTGAVAGMAIAALIVLFRPAIFHPLICLLSVPDWLLAMAGIWRGNNAVRLASGCLLGALYAINWYHLIRLELPLELWAVNAAMLVFAVVGVRIRRLRAPSRANKRAGV